MIASVMESRGFTGNCAQQNLPPYFDRGRSYDVYYPQQHTELEQKVYYGLFLFIYANLMFLTSKVPRIFACKFKFANLCTAVSEVCM